MKVKQIKSLLKKSVEQNTPNLLDSILKVPISKNEEVFNMNTNLEKRSRKKFIIIPAVASFAVCCLAFCAVYIIQNKGETLLSLDVNPSIELVLNKQEKVVKCVAKNEDAKNIIGNMDLKNVEADTALNAIIGSLYQSGYLEKNGKGNDILLSVDNKDKTKTSTLENKYKKVLKTILKNNNTSGTILTQKDISNDTTKKLSEKYKISEGKASLIEKMIQKSPNLKFEEFANMNIKDIVSYMDNNKLKVDDLESDDIDDDADDILDELNEVKENNQDKIKDEKEKEQEKIKDEKEKEQEKIKDEKEKEQEKKEKEQDKSKEDKEKEQEKIKKEQERLKEQKEKEQERLKEEQKKQQELLKEQQEKQKEELQKQQELLKEQQEKNE